MDYDEDVVWGALAIAELTGISGKKVYHQLERGHLPAIKIGKTWAMRKSAWRRFCEERERQAMTRARGEAA